MKHEIVLTRGDLTLRPLTPDDGPALRELVDAAMWAGNSAPLPVDGAAMSAHLAELSEREGTFAFAVEQGGELVGRTSLYDLVPGLRVEVGHTVYARRVWGTSVNPGCKLLLFGHAFEEWALERVALRCDHRNARSHAAIARLVRS